MTKSEFKRVIADCNDILFVYNGKQCGVTSEVTDSVPTFQMWYGVEKRKEYSDAAAMLEDSFFDGKTLLELFDIVKIRYI